MFSYTEGRRIARIKRKKKTKGAAEYLHISFDNPEDGVKEVILPEGDKLIPMPNRDVVEKIYVSAPSGAGKSTWCGKWIAEFTKMFPEDDIFLFSSIKKDKALDVHKPTRITLDADLIADPIQPEEIPNSLAIFDDTDTIRDKKLNVSLMIFRDWLLEQGRHFNIRMLITSHLLSNYMTTRRILNEATATVVFPRSGSGTYHIKNFLKTYCGLDKKEIKKFLNLPSRWVAIYRSYPQYVIYERGAYFPKEDD
jgi:hypothetical protein